VSRYQAQYPDGVYRTHRNCPHPKCGEEVAVRVRVENGNPHFSHNICPECGRRFILDPLLVPLRYSRFVVLLAFYASFAMVSRIDGILWQCADAGSQFLQKVTGASKYHLSLFAILGGLVLTLGVDLYTTYWPTTLVAPLSWLWMAWPVIRLCWTKIRTGATESEGDSDILDPHETLLVRRFRVIRITLVMLLFPMTPLLIYIGAYFSATLSIAVVGFYWLDSKFLPPSRRRILKLAQKWSFGTAS
jgi:hypothetical protein